MQFGASLCWPWYLGGTDGTRPEPAQCNTTESPAGSFGDVGLATRVGDIYKRCMIVVRGVRAAFQDARSFNGDLSTWSIGKVTYLQNGALCGQH